MIHASAPPPAPAPPPPPSHYFILSNQLGYGVAGFGRLGFVVAFYYNKLFAVNAACFVNLVNSKF